jgi:hypothetical protein
VRQFIQNSPAHALIALVDSDADPDRARQALDLEHEQSRRMLDIQARAWASTARKWIWICSLAAMTVVAAGVGFLLL